MREMRSSSRSWPDVGTPEAFAIARGLRWLAYSIAAFGVVVGALWLFNGPSIESSGSFSSSRSEPDWSVRVPVTISMFLGAAMGTALFIALAAIIDLLASAPRSSQVQELTKTLAKFEPRSE